MGFRQHKIAKKVSEWQIFIGSGVTVLRLRDEQTNKEYENREPTTFYFS